MTANTKAMQLSSFSVVEKTESSGNSQNIPRRYVPNSCRTKHRCKREGLVGMALRNPKKQHRGTFNPYPSGVFTRYESKVIGNLFLLKPLLTLLGLEDIVDSVYPLASNRANVSVGEVCKILVLNRLNSPMPPYKVEDWADHVSLTSSGYLPAC